MTRALHANILLSLAIWFACPMPIINAEDRFNAAHPSTTPQVRLASWWFTRHAEKIAEIEAANDAKHNKSIELLMVGDSITNNFDKGGPG